MIMEGKSTDDALSSYREYPHRAEYSSLLKIFAVAIFFTTLLFAGLGLFLWNRHADFSMTQARIFHFGQMSGTLHHLDEVLTMSAHMAAATGDLRWEARYRKHEPLLDASLQECLSLFPDPSTSETVGRTKTANDRLVAMENRAFDLVHHRNMRAAAALLSGPAYEEQKRIYTAGIDRITGAMQKLAKDNIDKQLRRMYLSIAAITAVLLFSLAAWIVVYRLMGKYIVERRQAEEEREQSLAKLRNALGGMIQAMSLTVEARDPYTAGHQRRVADLARAIAREMGAPQDVVDGIRMAGAIHDIGKISVPAEILSKPAQLSDIESGLIKIHPQAGFDILKEIDFPWPVAQIVLQHHERLNGCGYPAGLTDGEIIPEAKIMAVADVVEAMASYRPYRPAIGLKEALEEIAQNRGILYDPAAVDACLRLFKEKTFHFSQ